MTQTEHLHLIRARCVELLEIAEKRTAGAWSHQPYDSYGESTAVVSHGFCDGIGRTVALSPRYGNFDNDATFIASCAGAAEAGWLATVAAIDDIISLSVMDASYAERNPTSHAITSAWPIELLNNK